MTMAAGAAVSLYGVSKSFGGMQAVNDVSLEIPSGQFVTLLGPSGCGKTTTLRLIGGFEFPDRGEIAIDGVVMGNLPPYRRPTSLVFQAYALFPHLTIAENVGFGLRERRISRSEIAQRVEQVLNLVELPGFGSRHPTELSGGQQQRVALARSLVLEPTVLLLDEPLGALDLRLRRQMQIELKQIQRRIGITFLAVTHDQEEALTMSDRIVVMNAGKVEQEGTPEEVFRKPRTRFVAEFTGSRNVLPGRVLRSDTRSAQRWALLAIGGLEAHVETEMFEVGDEIDVVLRPEAVQVRRDDEPDRQLDRQLDREIDPDAGRISWQSTVVDQIYKGSVREYAVTWPDGRPLTVESPHAADVLAVGDRVNVSFAATDLVVLPNRRAGETNRNRGVTNER